ncbi:MAG: pyrroline-5-carboxylate reductase [Gammaproteobacteria bacterium RBG_16_57_12]|nr:MAG: pyrroline-5-carboxylate reductase [Gammaproteobacteria bacterium RBG_16_57_12]
MKDSTIAFIGGGNMARSLVGGLIAGGCQGTRIHVSDHDEAKLQALQASFGVNVHRDNHQAAGPADVVVLAVKPQALHEVSAELAATLRERRPLVMSIAAGIREAALQRWLGGDRAIVRVMPNTPALVQSGASVLYANSLVTDDQRDLAESIMRTVGLTLWVDDEDLMDPVTALSGSGPAYIFLIMEALEQAGEKLGLSREMARLLTLQTTFGAAKMALESSEDVALLRQRVTSPGGTTEQALKVLEQGGLRRLMDDALAAACRRSRELAELLGKN